MRYELSSFLIQDLFIFVTGDPIDNVNQVTSLFLPKDQITYSASASSSTRTRALNIDLSKSVELRKCSSNCSFLSPFELDILGISC